MIAAYYYLAHTALGIGAIALMIVVFFGWVGHEIWWHRREMRRIHGAHTAAAPAEAYLTNREAARLRFPVLTELDNIDQKEAVNGE